MIFSKSLTYMQDGKIVVNSTNNSESLLTKDTNYNFGSFRFTTLLKNKLITFKTVVNSKLVNIEESKS